MSNIFLFTHIMLNFFFFLLLFNVRFYFSTPTLCAFCARCDGRIEREKECEIEREKERTAEANTESQGKVMAKSPKKHLSINIHSQI